MQNYTLDAADKAAMILGGGLFVLGIVVTEFIETLVSPHTLDETSTAGDVIVHVIISPSFSASIIALGLGVWLLYALYRLANGRAGTAPGGR